MMKLVSAILLLAGFASLCHGNAFRGARVRLVVWCRFLSTGMLEADPPFFFLWTNQQRRLDDVPGIFVFAEDDFFQVIEGSGNTKLGNVLDNDSADTEITVDSYTEYGTFLGSLNVKSNGDVEYTPPFGLIGTEQFEYTVCDTLLLTTCDIAVVTIQVVADPNLPSTLPTAVNDAYKLKEGETLKVSASGILSNDVTPSDTLIVCASTSV